MHSSKDLRKLCRFTTNTKKSDEGLIDTEGKEILQKTTVSDEPPEFSGKNLRDRKALQIVDLFDRKKDVTVRLTSLFMDYKTTHLGFSIDPPSENWDITDVTILDNKGRTYWVSITRSVKDDPFFGIRVITDAIPEDADELLVSVRRIYLRDDALENRIVTQLSHEEKEVLNLVSTLGTDGTITAQVSEIRKRLRDLERRRFFKLPIVREELKGPWSFAFKIDHNLRKSNNKCYKLKESVSSGDMEIHPVCLKTGIIRNRLICNYRNESLLREVLTDGKIVENDESLLFLEGDLTPIPPAVSVFDEITGREYFPGSGHHDILNRGSGNVLISGNNLKLNYQFEPFDVSESVKIRLYGMEGCLPEPVSFTFEDGAEHSANISVKTGGKTVVDMPLKIRFKTLSALDDKNRFACEIRYILENNPLFEEFWISRAIFADEAGRVFNMEEVFRTEEQGKTTVQTIFHIPSDYTGKKLTLTIRNYYYRLVVPAELYQDLSNLCSSGFEGMDPDEKIIMPGALHHSH
ncbi:MAG: hypothetical protein LWY06_03750 [Firmicutes bacterium]|nr:hypothetical protein [Bacillota bacterium]